MNGCRRLCFGIIPKNINFTNSPVLLERHVMSVETSIRAVETSMKAVHMERTIDNTRLPVVSGAEITCIKDLSPTTKHFTLRVEHQDFTFLPGQWVDFFIPTVDTVGGYSICSGPDLLQKQRLLHLAVKFSEHPPAKWMHTQAKVGSQVALRVGGDFYFDLAKISGNQRLLLIAGGVGINPLYSIFQSALTKQNHITLMYSASQSQELIFREEISKLVETHGNTKCHLFITSEDDKENRIETDNERITVSTSRITRCSLASALCDTPTDTVCYLCGPPLMTDQLRCELLSLGLNEAQIMYEKWW